MLVYKAYVKHKIWMVCHTLVKQQGTQQGGQGLEPI